MGDRPYHRGAVDPLSRIQRQVRVLTWMYAISLVLTFILLCLTWLIDLRIP